MERQGYNVLVRLLSEVLILLLMEYGHGVDVPTDEDVLVDVLILLLMEYGHGGRYWSTKPYYMYRLNPSFNGIWSWRFN